ncbi:Rrf2 family transcriptional regulator [Archangium lansingense]|jgi:Rrf2 family protein|uniref:Rrf2 family transcriptional regulator n=1 Tax=Archangium lansingense TaxID=2995310 RepID=A0ABT4AMQ1_9BACT|nr:Rrf2 family transcriptional regulator [Archangium lansinium]MCY1082967.1 Rrf2 family transcriptional regulator [Archangium lansinium]
MSTSSRFAVAIHVLTLLAYSGGEALTSEFMAGSVNTNPVVIRRMLAALRAAKLVSSQGGPGGGWQLLRPPEAITLRDVYRAVEESTLFPLHSREPNPRCPVGANIQTALTAHFEVAHQALEQELARTTIADVMREVKSLAG